MAAVDLVLSSGDGLSGRGRVESGFLRRFDTIDLQGV
jgi:hypothetical protein